nr:MAG TPA: hypothetical protein [Caudoviricetes sp.]
MSNDTISRPRESTTVPDFPHRYRTVRTSAHGTLRAPHIPQPQSRI